MFRSIIIDFSMRHADLISVSQTLLLDADDTLWENNIYFDRAIAQFIAFLDHKTHTPNEVRDILLQVERKTILTHGYGLISFTHSLVRTFEQLSVDAITPELHTRILAIAQTIAEHPVEIIAGVPETLTQLASRHHLILVTKGDVPEQSGKVERSGLKQHFAAVEIVAEKDPATYSAIAQKYALAHESTWMVGNSPRSDVNPALRAGLNAVFVPHDNTWVLEHEEVGVPDARGRLLRVERFTELAEHF